ncbi:hypothetical protein ACFW3D_33670 [Streptomyces sp. NPDC058864]
MFLLWAAVIASSPWLPTLMGIVDLSGVSIMLSMLICSLLPSFLLGALLGRTRSFRLLAACGVMGPALWILDFTARSDPDVHSSNALAVAFAVLLALVLVVVPLAGGAMAGWSCTRPVRPAGVRTRGRRQARLDRPWTGSGHDW